MKTIEEKAKAYDEALERARVLGDGKHFVPHGMTVKEYIFPELRESEDERIREALIEEFTNQEHVISWWGGVKIKDILSYLERQKEQKPAWNEEDEKIRHCIGLILTDAPEKRFKDYNFNLKECLVWLGNNKANAEWSEEDEMTIISSIDWMKFCRDRYVTTQEGKKDITFWIEKLKSLRPSRKLSEDQIYTLERICSNLHLRASDDAPKLDEIIEILKRK